MLTKIYDMLKGKLKDYYEITPQPSTPRPITTSRPTTPKPTEPPTKYPERTTVIDGQFFICPKQGYFKHPTTRTKFVSCLYLNDHWLIFVMDCPAGTYWSDAVKGCTNSFEIIKLKIQTKQLIILFKQ